VRERAAHVESSPIYNAQFISYLLRIDIIRGGTLSLRMNDKSDGTARYPAILAMEADKINYSRSRFLRASRSSADALGKPHLRATRPRIN